MKKIVNIEYKPKAFLKIELDDKTFIEITLSEEDYTGPEAISLNYNTGEVIVFT